MLCVLCVSGVRGEDEGAGEGEGAGEAAPPAAGDQNAGPIVRQIQIRGNLRVRRATILRMIRTRIGRPFDRAVWEEDWNRLKDSNNFLQVTTAEPVEIPGGVLLVIDVIELATVKKIEFKGAKAVKRADLLGVIRSSEGGQFQEGLVYKDVKALKQYYQEKAFKGVEVSHKIEVISKHRQFINNQWEEVNDEVNITFTVEEGNPTSVRGIRFVGNKIFDDAALLKVIQTKPRRLFRPGDLKDAVLEIDKQLLMRHYLLRGYMDFRVETVDVDVSDETYWNWFRKPKRLADVTYHLYEGEQYHVGELKVTGNKTVELDEILHVMRLKPGGVYSELIMQEDSERIQKLYGEYGRVFTRCNVKRNLVTDAERLKGDKNLFDVEMSVEEGAEVSVRRVITRGNTKTKDKVLIRELSLYPGDRIDTTKIDAAKNELKNLNYFEDDIRVSYEPTENPEEADLIIDVTEKNTGELNFGVGVSSVDSVLGNFTLSQRNFDYKDLPKSWRDLASGNAFVGAGQKFTISAQAGTARQRYSVSFFEPWAFDRPLRLGFNLFRSVDNNFKDFNETSNGVSLVAGRRLWGPRWDGDLTYTFKWTTIGDTQTELPEIFQQQEGTRFLSSLRPRLVYSSRDSTILPSRGLFFEAGVEVGGGPFLGSLDWIRPSMDITRYFTTYKTASGAKHILELHGSASMVEAYGSTDDVPPFLRFFGGGISSVRGFENRTIAPKQDGYIVGGKKSFLLSAEYSVPLYEEIVRGSAFVDAGSVWDAGNTDSGSTVTNEGGVRASMGLGVAVRTPFSPLPLRIYFSRAISKNDEDRLKTIDFTFGTRF